MMLKNLLRDLQKAGNPQKAEILQRFFKTGPEQYGEGDVFLGITVPRQRAVAKKYQHDITLADLNKLLRSKIHEHRLVALLMLVAKYQNANRHSEDGDRRISKNPSRSAPLAVRMTQKQIFQFYLVHTKAINNWDLVDLSAPSISGAHLYSLSLDGGGVRVNRVLNKLAKSKNLWERRIAMLSTFYYLKNNDPRWTLKLAKLLMNDKHDLIHKATGWMLREMGKRCGEKILREFLDNHYKIMPRVMLRYAIERLPFRQRQHYLQS